MSRKAGPASTGQMTAFDIEKVTNAFRIFSTNHKLHRTSVTNKTLPTSENEHMFTFVLWDS